MNTPNETYQKLDRAALWLLIGEFGGAALLLALYLLMTIVNLISPYTIFLRSMGEKISLGIALVYGTAYLGNLVIGNMGLYLYTTEQREGYPGTGHLTNWMVLSATLIFIIAGIAIAITDM